MNPTADAHAPFQACKGPEPHLFISYAHMDKALVYPIITAWHAAGYRIWYDEGIDPGNEWPDEVARALADCARFVVFVTPQSVASINVRNEIHFALNRAKPFLAVHLEETTLPDGLALRMGDIQAIMKFRMGEADFARKTATVIGEPPKGTIPAIEIPAEAKIDESATPAPDGREKRSLRARLRGLRDAAEGGGPAEFLTLKRAFLVALILFIWLNSLGHLPGIAIFFVPLAPIMLHLFRHRHTPSRGTARLALPVALIALVLARNAGASGPTAVFLPALAWFIASALPRRPFAPLLPLLVPLVAFVVCTRPPEDGLQLPDLKFSVGIKPSRGSHTDVGESTAVAIRNATVILRLSDTGWMGAGTRLDRAGHIAACQGELLKLADSAEISVQGADGRFGAARLFARPPGTGRVVLKLPETDKFNIELPAMGDADALQDGAVLTVGAVTPSGGVNVRSGSYIGTADSAGDRMLKIGLPFSPGETGAPVIDAAGRLVGVAVCAAPDADGAVLAYRIGDYLKLLPGTK